MLDQDVIQPTSSPWASPIVLVKKNDGSMRFYVDYRHLNSITKLDVYPLPRIDDTLDVLAGARFFRGAGTGPAGPAVAGPMFTPSLRHDDVLLALTIQYYTSAAVTGHLSN